MTEKKTQFNVYLPPELVRAIKHRCIDEGTSLSSFVERILGDYLEKNASASATAEKEPAQ
ncbi:ribbon-helix-helix domain-containing protein [Nesterenkonia haasae]|uniref:ribbon-helix-helix domain-containing protein n=1 Tax=Nesterenkonia haasae TaxID=2587813 RepID=UPI0013912065|nr:ribbon-helix-helix domain-containing protein [Nesterenkonia haasae]NDK32037.1 CopG family transcriptional regulator [Nesterenkonia haasae]